MADTVLLSASPDNIEACVALATEHGLGIELMAFAYPACLDNDWQAVVSHYKALLAPVRDHLTMHGPFFDMSPGSLDARINALTAERYRHALRIAAELQVKIVVFHANFIAAIRTEEYRRGWQERNVVFWGGLAEEAQRLGVMIAVENMWEFDPFIIGDVLRKVEHPHLRACLDVGHAHLFSDTPFGTWLETLAPYIIHVHINNNPGDSDMHQSLVNGVLDYRTLLPRVRALPHQPSLTLEMDTVADMRASLPLLELARRKL
ncbi:MAG: sugar phosphate isomerase/epimerase family protein [Chloroflexota bacterium]|nr:sugar phosphate isomerase/epimerase family protein [Chloroflexota bacterium]